MSPASPPKIMSTLQCNIRLLQKKKKLAYIETFAVIAHIYYLHPCCSYQQCIYAAGSVNLAVLKLLSQENFKPQRLMLQVQYLI